MKQKLIELNVVKRKIWDDYAQSYGISYHELWLYSDTISYEFVVLKVALLELGYRILGVLGIVKLEDTDVS